jgi:multiple sugar transport system permease protein
VFSIVLSFTRYDVLSQARYVGVENYKQVLTDPTFFKSLLNTLYMVAAIPLGMIVSLGIALLLNRRVRAIGFYRASFYMPAIVPIVAASLMWIWILNPSYGLVNGALGWVFDTRLFHGIEHLVSRYTAEPFHFTLPLWLQDKNWSKPSLILMKLWAAGGGMIIWLAGLQSIPQDLYEAARVDGASAWQRFRNVTIPMLSPYILFNAIIGVIGTMQIFSEAYIMTPDGQPADSTLFYAYYLFKQAFQYFRMGYASALAWILFLIVLALTLVQMWLSKRWVHYEQ